MTDEPAPWCQRLACPWHGPHLHVPPDWRPHKRPVGKRPMLFVHDLPATTPCGNCGKPFRPTHDIESSGPTVRHPFQLPETP